MQEKESKEDSQRKKLRLKMCILSNLALFGFTALSIFFFSNKGDNKYLRFGPQNDLDIMGVKIDTWVNYAFLQLFLAFVRITDVLVNEIVSPILGFNIYNPDKEEITEFTRIELQMYANIHWFINALRSTLMVLVTISQLDIAILQVVYGEITTFYTIRMLLNEKKFPNEDNKHAEYSLVTNDALEMV